MNASLPKHIRVLPELRAAQVERGDEMYPCEVLYFGENPDLGSTPVPPNYHRVSLLGALRHILNSDAPLLEVPEPLWIRELPRTTLLLTCWRILGIFRGRRRPAVTYAIENNSVARVISGRRNVPSWATKLVSRAIGVVWSALLDRMAFGSPGAHRTYEDLKLSNSVQTKIFPELPAASGFSSPAVAGRAVFVGRLEDRKGLRKLMAAWPEVERSFPSAVVTIVGSGPLESAVKIWVSLRTTSRVYLPRLEHSEIKELLRHQTLLVAPSVPDGRWREQIGLPIGEALAEGLTIVASSDTGLALWLSNHGHTIVPTESLDSLLARSLLAALRSPLDRSSVRNTLNAIPGRILADGWLHSAAREVKG